MNRSDILEDSSLFIKSDKTHHQRIIPLHKNIIDALYGYLVERSDENQALFVNDKGERINARTIQRLFEKYNISPSQFRHRFMLDLAKAGIPDNIIKKIAGRTPSVPIQYLIPSERIAMGFLDEVKEANLKHVSPIMTKKLIRRSTYDINSFKKWLSEQNLTIESVTFGSLGDYMKHLIEVEGQPETQAKTIFDNTVSYILAQVASGLCRLPEEKKTCSETKQLNKIVKIEGMKS